MNIYDELEKAWGDKSKCPEYLRKIISLAREELKKRVFCPNCFKKVCKCERNKVIEWGDIVEVLGEPK